MNCKTCGSSTSEKNTPRGLAYECNQDNGECVNERGYPTSSWAQTLPPRGGNGGARRPAPAASALGRGITRSTSTDDQIKWQTCLKVAGTAYTGLGGDAKTVIAFARELFAAKPVVAKAAAKPALVEASDGGDEGAIF